MENPKIFTVDELKEFDGRSGKPVYVGYKGKVYDLTDSDNWVGGDHFGHAAGQDLTLDMEIAPHADDVMKNMKIVGTLRG